MSTENNDYNLSPKEFARLVGVSSSTVRRWEEELVFTSVRTPSGYRKFALSDVPKAIEYKNQVAAVKKQKSHDHLYSVNVKQAEQRNNSAVVDFIFQRATILSIAVLIMIITASAIVTYPAVKSIINEKLQAKNVTNENPSRNTKYPEVDDVNVLAADSSSLARSIISNIGWNFRSKVQIADLQVNGPAVFLGDIEAQGQNLNLGTGRITASNVLYGIEAGEGIRIAGQTQTPLITNIDPGSAQEIFKNVKVGSNTITASSNTDTLTFEQGSGITLIVDGKKITIASSQSGYSYWTTEVDGVSYDNIEDGSAVNFVSGDDITVSRSATNQLTFSLQDVIDTVTGIDLQVGGYLNGSNATITFDNFSVDASGNIRIAAGSDFYIGNVNLGSTGVASGASLIGVDGTNISQSASGNLQTVLENMSAAMGSGSSKWTIASNVMYPNNYSTVDFSLGGTSPSSSPFGIDIGQNILYLGDGANDSNNPTIHFKASDGTNSGTLSYADSDRFVFTGGDIVVDGVMYTGSGVQQITLANGLLNPSALPLITSGTSPTTSSVSGLEVLSSQIGLIRGCSNGEVLKWNSGTGRWTCSPDSSGVSGVVDVKEDGAVPSGSADSQFDTLNFVNNFTLVENSSGVIDVDLASNIGIGTAPSGSYALSVNGATNTTSLYLSGTQITASANEINLLTGRSGTLLDTNNVATQLSAWDQDASNDLVTTDIGSTVQGYNANTSFLGQTIETGEITDGSVLPVDIDDNGQTPNDGQVLTYNNANSKFNWIDATSLGTNYWGRNSGSGYVYPAVVTDKVGIGNTAPTESLDVTGNIAVSGTVDGRDISADGSNLDTLYTTIGLSALTSGEVDQLENIGSTTINSTQWGYLGAMNQSVATTDAVTFTTINTGQGANELYAMDQNVRTSDTVQFAGLQIGGSTPSITSIVSGTGTNWTGATDAELVTRQAIKAFVDNAIAGVTIDVFTTFTADSGSTTANTSSDTLTINGSGSISTSISGDTLTITGTDNDTTYSAGSGLGLTGTTFSLGGAISQTTRLYDTSYEYLYLNNGTGNVGIGTTATGTYKVNVGGSFNTTNLYLAGSEVTSTAAELNLLDGVNLTLTAAEFNLLDGRSGTLLDTNNVSTQLSAWDQDSSNDALITSLTSGYLPYYDGSNLANSTIYLTGGNLGIGTTNPVYKLDIANSTLSRGLNITMDVGVAGYSHGGYIDITNPSGTAVGQMVNANASSGQSSTGYWSEALGGTNAYGFYTNTSGNTGTSIGIYANAYGAGASSGKTYGGMFLAETPNLQEAYGIYAAAYDTGGGKAWAGYFDDGDVFISNNLGIGTTATDTYTLNINGSLNTTTLYLAGTQVSATATELNLLSGRSGTLLDTNNVSTQLSAWDQDSSNDALITSLTSGYLPYYDGSNLANSAFYQTGGNLGIGTTAPGYKLDVNGDIRIVDGSELFSYGSATLGNRTYTEDNYVTDGQTFTASIDALDQQVKDLANGEAGMWQDQSGYINPINATSIVITDTGRIGIGTTNPSNPLSVVGNANITGNVGIGTTDVSTYALNVAGSANMNSLYIGGTQVSATATELNILSGATITTAELNYLDNSTVTNGGIVFGNGSNFTQDASSLFWNDTDNRLGIGTTTPSTALELFGTTAGFQMSYDANNYGKFTIGNDGTLTLAGVSAGGSLTNIARFSTTGVNIDVPTSFNATGDVSIANDLQFTNQTASYIKTLGPLTIEAGESYESNNLKLKTYNSGRIVLDAAGGVALNQAQNWDLASSTTAMNLESGLLNIDTTNSRIGIGTTAPVTKLDVTGTGWIRGGTGNSGGLYVNGSGQVGIGTTDTSNALTIVSSQSQSSRFVITETPSSTPLTMANFRFNTGSTMGNISGVSVGGTQTFYFYGGASRQIGFGANSSTTPHLLINTSGYVGIGTTNPTEMLSVAGRINMLNVGSTASGNNLYADGGNLYWGTTQLDTGASGNVSSLGSANYIPYFSTSTDLADSSMYTDGTNIGIGTTDVSIYMLNIGGTANMTNISLNDTLVTATATELNTLSGVNATLTSAELNYLDGTTVTNGGIMFGNASYMTQDAANFFWDDSANRLGIGTTTPSSMLDLFGMSAGLQLSYDSSNYGKFTIGNDGTLTLAGVSAGGSLTNIARFATTGINIDVPTSFNATGDVSIANDLQFTNQTASYIKTLGPLTIESGESFENNNLTLKTYGTGNLVFDLTGTGSGWLTGTDTSLIFDTRTSTDTDYWMGIIDDGGNDDDDIFAIGDGDVAGTNPFLSIKTNGYVGIGTTNPSSLFDVSGDINTSTSYKIGGSNVLSASSSAENLFMGIGAGITAPSGATQLTLIGRGAGASINNTNADQNTFVGAWAGTSVTSGYNNVLIGNDTGSNLTTGHSNFIGGSWAGVGATAAYNVALGYSAGGSNSSGNDNVMVGSYSNVTSGGNYNTLLGSNSSSAYNSSIVLGYQADATTSHQLVIGGDDANGYIDEAYIGGGVVSASPTSVTLSATGGSGTNIAGANFTLAGGRATGNADGGDLIFKTSDIGSSGTTLQSLTEKMRLTDEGSLGIGTSNPVGKLYIAGSSLNTVVASTGYLGIGTTNAATPLEIFGTNAAFQMSYNSSNYGKFTIGSDGTLTLAGVSAGGSLTNIARFSTSQVNFDVPTAFNAAGDVSVAYDLYFTNQTASYIKSDGPLSIVSGEAFENNDLTLETYGTGNIILKANSGNLWADGTAVGIGTTAPARALHVLVGSTAPPVRFQDSDGYCEIDPTSTTWSCTSDATLKKNVETLSSIYNLERLNQLRPVSFKWKTQSDENKRFGLIAQEVEQLFPEFVQTDENGLKSVSYGSFTPILISAMQEQQIEIAGQKNSLAKLTEQLELVVNKDTGAVTSRLLDTLAEDTEDIAARTTVIEGEVEALAQKDSQIETRLNTIEDRLNSLEQASASASLETLNERVGFLEQLFTGMSSTESADLSTYLADLVKGQVLGIKIDEATLSALTVAGDTNVNNLAVTGEISSGLLTINGFDDTLATPAATISTLGGSLKLQHLGLGEIEFMAGKSKIDTGGNFIMSEGDLVIETGVIKGNDQFRGIDIPAVLGSTYLDITFDTIKDTNEYAVNVTPTWLTNVAVINKRTDGFRIQFSTPAPFSGKVDWMIIE